MARVVEILDQENFHPTKRRKLETQPDHQQSLVGQLSYLTLASVSSQVNISNIERRNSNANDGLDSAVSIENVSKTQDRISIEISASWLKHRATITALYDLPFYTVLKDSTTLGSIVKAQKEPHRAFQACHAAKLELGGNSAQLTVEILWQNTSEARDRTSSELQEILLRYSAPVQSTHPRVVAEEWHVQEFYNNVHVPMVCPETNAALQADLLQCELYPFQRRAVRWLLSRERVQIHSSGEIQAQREDDDSTQLPAGFHQYQDKTGTSYYASPALGVASSSREAIVKRYKSINGGLLGEAMGLGKTVEMIALMCLHTPKTSPHPLAPTLLSRSGATLIITPPTILEQWREEIQGHAPSLRVYHYQGMRATSKKARKTLIEELCDHDVVLTTYGVIAKELHYVMERPDRALRDRPRAEPPKSPLDQILWWRVCLDEAQMIESGVSAAAQVARLIPRVNAWAVTGTPIKQSHRDLYGLLLFLRYEPWCNSPRSWDYLITYHRPMFRDLMSEIAIRHSKEAVRDELRLPPQSRHTISMSFTNIEQAHYAQLFYDMYQDIGVNRDGSPLDDQWDPNAPKTTEKMRMWLTRLRQTCIHPEVGGRNRRALGRNNGPLRTVAQVLDVMIDQTETLLRAEQRNMLTHRIRQGQIFENAKKREDALKQYSEAYAGSCEAVDACRKSLEAELQLQSSNSKTDSQPNGAKTEDDDEDSGDFEADDNDSPIMAARQRLRAALEVKHVCIFFMANIYYQLKSDEERITPESEDFRALEKSETEAYEEAKKIRTELLKEAAHKANRKVATIKVKKDEELAVIPEMSMELDYTGIESRKIYEKLYRFCQSMNAQADQLTELRKKMVVFLQQALIDEDEGVELQGDEYENSTKHQDEMYAYMEALRALHADRSDALSGQENYLIRSEMKNFLKAAKDGEGPAPELMIKLLAEREDKRIKSEQGSLRGIVGELRALVSSLEWSDAAGHSTRAKAEMGVADQILQHAIKLTASQNKSLADLEQEVTLFRNIMNSRLEYYKALQRISDTVAPYREENVGKALDQPDLDKSSREEKAARNRYSSHLAKSRYLLHIKAESSSENVQRVCVICQSEFEIGTITSCGHVFCKEDIQLWYREHGNCPVCKRRLRAPDFFDITYKPSEMAVQAEDSTTPGSPNLSADRIVLSNSIYSDIATKQLNEIKNMEIRGASFGSKVDTICRHLHWLRAKDPGSKTLVFSQFREVLDVLGRAFKQNAITYSKCDDKSAIQEFKSNPSIEVFLLHARAHSAGLNLVVASHVIFCEPLINTALELQAIARVHRIGQHRPTNVWMYLIADTIEEAIYDISVKRRLAHIKTKDQVSRSGTQTPILLQESAIDAANSKELQAADLSKALAPGKNGGEMVDRDDLWPCLFSRPCAGKVQPGFLGASADAMGADSDIGRFLRVDAAERRRHG